MLAGNAALVLMLAAHQTSALGALVAGQPDHQAPTPSTPLQTPTDLSLLSLEDLMKIEVKSVSKSAQRIADAAAAVTVITNADIQRSGLRQVPEVLRLVPGLFVQRGTQSNTWTVAARGLPYDFNNNLLVLQDGRALYTPVFGGVVWSTVDPPTADLERIEVIRGPGGTLWGANAVNGVINITSKRANDTQGLMLDSRVGMDGADATVRYGGRVGAGTYYRVYGKGRSLNDLHTASGVKPRYGLESVNGGFRVDRGTSTREHVTLQGDFFGVNAQNSLVHPIYVAPFSTPGLRDHRFRGGNVLARWTRTASESSDYSLQAYFDHLGVDTTSQQHKISTFDVDFQHQVRRVPRHDVIYGFSGRLQPFESEPTGTGLSASSPLGITYIPRINLYVASAYVQDTITWVPNRLKLTLGSKLEYNNLTRFEVQPNVRVVYTPNDSNSGWAGVSRAVRTPGLDNRTFYLPVAVSPNAAGSLTEIAFAGNALADAEHLIAYEIGYRSQIAKRWSVDLAVFHSEKTGLLVPQRRAPVAVSTPVPHLAIVQQDINGADTKHHGAEVSSTLMAADHWRLTGSYSWLVSRVVFAEPNTNFSGSFYGDARHQGQLHSYIDIRPGLQLNASLYGVASSHSGAIPAYARFDAAAVWQATARLGLELGIQNGLDARHSEFQPRNGPQPEIGRTVHAQLIVR